MLTKTALNNLTQAVSARIINEVDRYNQKVSKAVTEGDLFEDYCRKVLGKDIHINATWDVLKNQFPPVFAELLSVLRSERKDNTLKYPYSYQLKEIIRADVERLAMNLDEFDSNELIVEQMFEKIYPMLVDAKYIYFENEKFEPTFELTLPAIEFEEDIEFKAPYPESGNENSQPEEESYDEGDWD